MRARLSAAIVILMGALALLVPAAINRAPFVFYDTTHYLQTGQSIWDAAHVQFAIFATPDRAPSPADTALGAAPPATGKTPDRHESMAYVGGRSPYYSVILVLLVGVLGLWGAVLFQALVGSYLAWRVVALATDDQRTRSVRFLVLMGVLTLASTLPYFAGFVMPDVFAGYAIVAIALLAVPPRQLSVPHRIAVGAIACFAILAHATILVLAALVVCFAVIVFRWSGLGWSGALGRAKWAAAALAVGLAGAPVFALACQLLLNDTPRSPPYLLARVLADGPGRLYLAEACRDPAAYEICKFRTRRLDDHNDILWSIEPDKGVFQAADYSGKLRLQNEERRFVLAAVGRYPLTALGAALRNAGNQLGTFAIAGEVGATKVSWDTMLGAVIPKATRQITGSRSYHKAFPFGVADPVQILGVVAGFCWLASFLLRRPSRAVWLRGPPHGDEALQRQVVGVVLALFAILVVNAVVCGVLSGPTPRYQGRLTWLVPAMALVLELGVARSLGAIGVSRPRQAATY